MIPNKVKYVAAKAAVYTGSIVAITAVVFVGGSVLEANQRQALVVTC